MMQLMRPAERVILTVTDSTVETRTGRGAPLILNLDGEEVEIDLGDDLTMKTRAEWKDETLELRNDFGGGLLDRAILLTRRRNGTFTDRRLVSRARPARAYASGVRPGRPVATRHALIVASTVHLATPV